MEKLYSFDSIFTCNKLERNDDNLKLLVQEVDALSTLYPNIREWYRNIFAQGFLKAEREIVVVTDMEAEIAAFALLKNTFSERKICTFYVNPYFREAKVGTKFFPILIDYLGGKDIGISMNETVHPILHGLLDKFSFELNHTQTGLYLPNKKEYFYHIK